MGIFDQLFKKNKQKLTVEEEKAKATEEPIFVRKDRKGGIGGDATY